MVLYRRIRWRNRRRSNTFGGYCTALANNSSVGYTPPTESSTFVTTVSWMASTPSTASRTNATEGSQIYQTLCSLPLQWRLLHQLHLLHLLQQLRRKPLASFLFSLLISSNPTTILVVNLVLGTAGSIILCIAGQNSQLVFYMAHAAFHRLCFHWNWHGIHFCHWLLEDWNSHGRDQSYRFGFYSSFTVLFLW